ncbi:MULTISPECIES: helix-turn-helix transcriptional regulator [Cohnella]|uniref:helix-turn-helix transcriptional regulator n=1 Tax=Cohnella TaxID=329857 RepID=UPI0009BAB718|nr:MULTISPECIES: AraC family transcriptional regulator [Cohnella]MBN2981428.1 helix-turn-helix domain-containing protein [Cohnella algarum]
MQPPTAWETSRYGLETDHFVEYVRRSGPYTMQSDHFHSYYEIYYLLSGKRIYFVKDRTYTVEQGDLVFIAKNELHKTLHAGESGHERVVIHFGDAFIRERGGPHAKLLLSPFEQKSHVIRLPLAEQKAVAGTIRRIVAEIRNKPPGYELTPAAGIVELLLATARYLLDNEPVPVFDSTPLHAKISEIVRYLNEHYHEPVKLGGVAESFFISPYYLSRMFKEVTGFAFSDYLILTRIKEAQRLLRDSEATIAEIASSVGFDNFSHFGKTFKKITRQSPREYRKATRS